MGKITGFLEYLRKDDPQRPPLERVGNWDEFHIPLSDGARAQQGGRCMQVVWDAAPVPSPVLVELCLEKLGWKKSTTYTVLKKLCDKGLLKNEDTLVSVLAHRETVTAAAAAEFIEKTFSGSLPSFLTAFMNN